MKNFLLPTFLLLTVGMFAQQKLKWKDHVKMADEFYAKAMYADAAEHYEAAWRQKTRKKEFIAKAGECYYIVKDYKKAANAYKNVKDEGKDFPLAGLRYARCLKQDGNFDEASREFVYFLNSYEGDDKAIVTEIVQNEIRGCELAIKLYAEPENESVQIDHLGSNINSPETEFAPIPFNNNVLYFSSTMSNKARIYFSMRDENGEWEKATVPKSFPDIPDKHYCNGTLSPDGKRFYFTICKSIESWGGLTTKCEIHLTKKIGDTWTAPERLRDYINMAGHSTTHPYVVHADGKEILYFSSNREGSIGGMDLWYAERNIDSDDIDFTFPTNLGPQVNTLGDDITPFYAKEEGVLYFSSNGQITLGGHDIFKTKGSLTNWSTPENIGLPFNGPADDFFFVKTPSGPGGFFSSNRTFGIEKIVTTNEDLFEFGPPQTEPAVAMEEKQKEPVAPPSEDNGGEITSPATDMIAEIEGAVYDKNTDEKINDVVVTLYEVTSDRKKRLLTTQPFTDGKFKFSILPNRDFYLEARKDGYLNGGVEFSSASGEDLYEEDIFIQKFEEEVVAAEEKPVEKTTPKEEKKPVKINTSPRNNGEVAGAPGSRDRNSSKPVAVDTNEHITAKDLDLSYEGGTYTSKGRSDYDYFEFTTSAPRHSGEYFKIQMTATDGYNPDANKFDEVKSIGRIHSEFLVDKKLHRILLGDYFSLEEAKDVLKQVKQFGFSRAFIVRYHDGERYGMIYR